MVRRMIRPWTMGAADNLHSNIQACGNDEGTFKARELPTWRRVNTRERQQLRLPNNSILLPPAGWKLLCQGQQISSMLLMPSTCSNAQSCW